MPKIEEPVELNPIVMDKTASVFDFDMVVEHVAVEEEAPKASSAPEPASDSPVVR